MTGSTPCVSHINISDGGVPKLPVPEAWVSVQGVAGDRQRNAAIHGGIDRALCLFSLEIVDALRQEGHSIEAGSSLENLTISGLDWAQLQPGDRLRIGDDLLIEIASYTAPCQHNARWFVDGHFNRISQKKHPGWSRLYARVLTEGMIRRGDPVYVEMTESNKEIS